MLGSQRTLFDLPRDVCWLNAAAYSPIPWASRDAGERGIARKVRPWEMEGANAQRTQGGTLEAVKRPPNGDWTAAMLAVIERAGPPVALASISSVHWSDGGLVDLHRVAAALRGIGARLVVDATHSVGVLRTDVRSFDPDFLVFPTYKWVLGPYGRAFLYVAKRWQDAVPLEQTAPVAAPSTPKRRLICGTRAMCRMHGASIWVNGTIL